jgi:hypothetical protein
MHGNALAHGNALTHGKGSRAHDSVKSHGNDEGAQQHFFGTTTNYSARQFFQGTAEALPSLSGKTHDKGCIAGHGIAVRSLSCVDAR